MMVVVVVVVVVVWVLSSKRFAPSGSILDYEYFRA